MWSNPIRLTILFFYSATVSLVTYVFCYSFVFVVSYFSYLTVCLVFLTLPILWVPICMLHFKWTPTQDGSVLNCKVFSFWYKLLRYTLYYRGKRREWQNSLCMPPGDFKAFTLVLLVFIVLKQLKHKEPSINRGHKNKRTKHNLHSGGI